MATYTPQDLDFADTAPVRIEAVDVIDGTPDEVWAVILDYPGWTEWFASLTSCRATSEPATGVGSTREVKLAGGVAFHERFIAWDEPNLWAFTGIEGPPIFEGLVERVTLREVAPGRTQVSYRMAIAPKRGLSLVVKVATRGIQKNLSKALRALDGVVADRRTAAGGGAG